MAGSGPEGRRLREGKAQNLPGGPRQFWYRLPIKYKLLSVSCVLIAFMVMINVLIVSQLFSNIESYRNDLQKTVDLYLLEQSIDQSNRHFERFVQYGQAESLEAYRRASQSIWLHWSEIDTEASYGPDARFEIAAIRYGWTAYSAGAERVLSHEAGVDWQMDGEFIDVLLKNRRIYGYLQLYLETLQSFRLRDAAALQASQGQKAQLLQALSMFGMSGTAALVLLIMLGFSQSISRPLGLLARRSAQIAHGDLQTADVHTPLQDEMGSLNRSFNEMNHRLRRMVESLREKAEIERQLRRDEGLIMEMQGALKEARLQSLRSQINPHFFFNAMNSISRSALLEKAGQTGQLVDALAGLLRYSLNNSGDLVTLERELHILKQYLYIQNIRYGSRLRYSVHLDPGIDPTQTHIPPLSIQPLVENAIEYAVESREEGGMVAVDIRRHSEPNCNGSIRIEISDGGGGIPAAVLARLHDGSRLLPPEGEVRKHCGIGIANVRQRLEMCFPGRSSFTISCPSDGGTCITLEIPEQDHD